MDKSRFSVGSQGERATLQDRLIAFFMEQDVMIGQADLADDASLIRSGLVDSSALLNLTLWVEREAGRPFDVTALDLPEDWDTVADIVRFVEELKKDRSSLGGASHSVESAHE